MGCPVFEVGFEPSNCAHRTAVERCQLCSPDVFSLCASSHLLLKSVSTLLCAAINSSTPDEPLETPVRPCKESHKRFDIIVHQGVHVSALSRGRGLGLQLSLQRLLKCKRLPKWQRGTGRPCKSCRFSTFASSSDLVERHMRSCDPHPIPLLCLSEASFLVAKPGETNAWLFVPSFLELTKQAFTLSAFLRSPHPSPLLAHRICVQTSCVNWLTQLHHCSLGTGMSHSAHKHGIRG